MDLVASIAGEHDLYAALRARADASGVTRAEIDRLAGFTSKAMPLNCWKYSLAAAPSIPRSSSIEFAASASSDARLSFKMAGSGGSRWFLMSSVR